MLVWRGLDAGTPRSSCGALTQNLTNGRARERVTDVVRNVRERHGDGARHRAGAGSTGQQSAGSRPGPGPRSESSGPDAATPEPATLILLTTGAAGTVIARWRKPGGSIARRLLTFRGLCPISLGSDLADRDLRRRRPRRRRWAGRFHGGPDAPPTGGGDPPPRQAKVPPRQTVRWRHPTRCPSSLSGRDERRRTPCRMPPDRKSTRLNSSH